MIVVQLCLDFNEGVLSSGFSVECGVFLCGQFGFDDQIVCEYCIVYLVILWLLEVVQVDYFGNFVVVFGCFVVSELWVKVGLCICLCSGVGILFDSLLLDVLLFYLYGVDE